MRQRHLSGETLLAIARVTGLTRATVRRYAQGESFPERGSAGPNPSHLDHYRVQLEQRMAEGCENAMARWCEIRDQEVIGTPRHFESLRRRTAHDAGAAHHPQMPVADWLSGRGASQIRTAVPASHSAAACSPLLDPPKCGRTANPRGITRSNSGHTPAPLVQRAVNRSGVRSIA